MSNVKEINNILLSGGSLRGIAYIGFLKYMEESKSVKINYKNIYGVSVGSIFGLLIAIGYTYNEMKYEILNKNLTMLKDINISNFLLKYGLDSGNNIINWIKTLLIKKGLSINITFKELKEIFNIDLHIITSNLETNDITVFNNENSGDLFIVKAIRMSIGIPVIMTVEKYNNVMYVDGGVVNNYPIHLINESENYFGIRLLTKNTEKLVKKKNDNIFSYISNVIFCFVSNRDKKKINYENTLNIYIENFMNTINLNMTKNDKINLIQVGYIQTKKYFEQVQV